MDAANGQDTATAAVAGMAPARDRQPAARAVPTAIARCAAGARLARLAWGRLNWRHWLAAAAIGGAVGCVHALHVATTVWDQWPQIKAGLALTISVRWACTMMLVACAQLFGQAMLLQHTRCGPVRPWHHVALLAWVVVFHALIAAPLSFMLSRAVHEAIALPRQAFWADRQGLSLLIALWVRSVPVVIILSVLTSLLVSAVSAARRSARALAAAQQRLADARRRALADDLQRAQATVEPEFLFSTLQLFAQHYEGAPALAQQVLDALIRYLRAALPQRDGTASTVGRQADLVRAYLEIESIRSGGLLQARVEVPVALRPLPVAPMLVLPLVADAVRRGAGQQRPHVLGLRVAAEPGRVVFEIDGSEEVEPGPEPAAVVEARRRLAQLYGHGAKLVWPRREGGVGALRLEVDIPEAA